MKSNFFAMIFRMRYVDRWGLIRSARNENVCEHSLDVAIIAHVLALIGNKRFGANFDPNYVAMVGLYHDASEILTGDLPTTIKYQNPIICKEYKEIEKLAAQKLKGMLPDYLREDYEILFEPLDEEVQKIVKGADKLAALIKCIEEIKLGNTEFKNVEKTIMRETKALNRPEVEVFLDEFLPAYRCSLVEQELLEI